MVNGDIDGLTGVIVIGLSIGLGMVTVAPPVPGLGVGAFLGALATTVLFPLVCRAVARKAMREIDLEQMDKLSETLRSSPGNAAALWRLAQLTREIGLTGHSLRIAEEAIAKMPPQLFPAEHRQFDQWRQAGRSQTPAADPCLGCGALLAAGTVWCPACGRAHLSDVARGRWFDAAASNKLIGAWALLLIAVLGVPLANGLKSVSVVLAIGVMASLMAVGLVVFVHLLTGAGRRR
jgi:hypothetical protein